MEGGSHSFPCCLLFVGSLRGSEAPGPERNPRYHSELRRESARQELTAPSSGDWSRLPSEADLTKSKKEARALLVPRRQGLSHKDRCTHTCEVRGEPRGREPAPLSKPHLEFLSLLDPEGAGWHGKNGIQQALPPVS